MSARRILLASALVASPLAAQEQSTVESLADQFEYALVAGDYRVLPLTEDFTYTENGAQLNPWDGMWRTLTAVEGGYPELYPDLDYRVEMVADENTVVRVVEFEENTVQGVMAYRLTARDGQISSVNVLPVREEFGGDRGGTITLLQPMLTATMDGELVGATSSVWEAPVSVSGRMMRGDIVAYFKGGEALVSFDENRTTTGHRARFTADCERFDNGQPTTGVAEAPVLDPAQPDFRPFALGCGAQLNSGFFSNFEAEVGPIYTDPARGMALAFVRLDQAGTTLSFEAPGVGTVSYPGPRGAVENADTGEQFDGRILTNMITPMSVNGVFLFKFNEAGEIERIESFYRGAPLGWDAVPD